MKKIYFLQDVWSESGVDVMKAFDSVGLFTAEKNTIPDTADKNAFPLYHFDFYGPTKMSEMQMMIDTRPTRYPSNKRTFTIADITKNKQIRTLDIYLNLNAKFDVNVLLEDSKSNFLNSFYFFLLNIK